MSDVTNYITLDECEEMVIRLFPNKVLNEVKWITLGDETKQVYLDNAFLLVDSLKYLGYPKSISQFNSFPRVIRGEEYNEPPNRLKQCIAYVTVKLIQFDNDKRKQLINSGVTGVKIDKISEKFSTNIDDVNPINLIKRDATVKSLLRGLIITNGLIL